MTDTQLARFLPKIEHASGGCWLWMAGRARNGYGKFKINGRTLGAHRIAYLHFIGAIPDGQEIDHLCRNRACVNPTHLEAVAHCVNVQRGLVPQVMRVIKRGNLNMLGYKHTPEAKARIAATHRGKAMSAETRAKLSAAKLGRRTAPRSAETKAKMAEARRQYWARRKAVA